MRNLKIWKTAKVKRKVKVRIEKVQGRIQTYQEKIVKLKKIKNSS